MQGLVLASGSQYRAALLSRLGVEFQTLSPDIDESARADEPPDELATRLACQKAEAVRNRLLGSNDSDSGHTQPVQTLIIASDQVASMDNLRLGKPLSHDRACEQLASMSGRSIDFHTALHLLNLHSGERFTALDVTRATLRELDKATIERYVTREQPLDCAGSFKVESLGISLFEAISSQDPTALVGLPMIELCRGLRRFGMPVP